MSKSRRKLKLWQVTDNNTAAAAIHWALKTKDRSLIFQFRDKGLIKLELKLGRCNGSRWSRAITEQKKIDTSTRESWSATCGSLSLAKEEAHSCSGGGALSLGLCPDQDSYLPLSSCWPALPPLPAFDRLTVKKKKKRTGILLSG